MITKTLTGLRIRLFVSCQTEVGGGVGGLGRREAPVRLILRMLRLAWDMIVSMYIVIGHVFTAPERHWLFRSVYGPSYKIIWVVTSKNVHSDMRIQRRFRSACAFAQSDQIARMRRLIWVFTGCTCTKIRFQTMRHIHIYFRNRWTHWISLLTIPWR